MIPLEEWVAVVIFVSLILYVLGAGADFGSGLWDLLARGPRAKEQRDTIAKAIGPIWEANHVWLILVVVLLFVAFPRAFAVICTALHVPLTLMLIGIVLRGSAFTFRSYDLESDRVQHRWSVLFASASVFTPVMLGACVGAVASGEIRYDFDTGRVHTDFLSQWFAPFPICVGLFSLALFGFLAAVYLTLEAGTESLREDFRIRALGSGVAVGILAAACLALSRDGAPLLWKELLRTGWALVLHILTGLVAASALFSLWTRRYGLARLFAMVQVVLIVWGWAFSQFPYVVVPDLTFASAAAPPQVLRLLLFALAAGAVVLFPSLWYLFRLFKQHTGESDANHP